jgi:hypothetical protein
MNIDIIKKFPRRIQQSRYFQYLVLAGLQCVCNSADQACELGLRFAPRTPIARPLIPDQLDFVREKQFRPWAELKYGGDIQSDGSAKIYKAPANRAG